MVKAKIIFERTGILVGHDQISALCDMWGTTNPDEFMDKLNAMRDEDLKKWLERLRMKRKFLESYVAQEQKVYA